MNKTNQIEKKQNDLVFNPGSERNILAICLKNNDKLIEVEGQEIFAEHFSVPGHKYIYMAMIYLYSKKMKLTPIAIMEVLSNNKAKLEVDNIGGLEYLTILEEMNVSENNLDIFIKKVKQSYTRKSLMEIADDLIEFVTSDEAEVLNPSELIGYVEKQLSDLMVDTSSSEEVYKMGDATQEILDERAKTPAQIPGLEVGWPRYDELTGGAKPGDLIVIVAESKVGKSVTLTNWATNISIIDQIPILYIDTEMNEREQEDRILANLTGIPESEIVSGLYVIDTENGTAKEKIEKLKKAREKLQLGHYYHIHMPQFTPEKVNAIVRKFHLHFGIKAVFFDYIKIPSTQANFRTQQEYQALGFFASSLKELASMLKIPIFTAAQANRQSLGTEDPDASSIGGSYRILQLASKLMFLVNKSPEKIAKDGEFKGNQQLFIKYQRSGESDAPPIDIFFNKSILRQREA